MDKKYLFAIGFFGLVSAAFGLTPEGPISIGNIVQGSVDSISYIQIIMPNGVTYNYEYPDIDNPDNNEDGAKTVFAQLNYAMMNGLQIRVFHEGESGTSHKICGITLYSP